MNYFNIYQNIIKLAQLRGQAYSSKKSKLEGYEKHHILPKCMGGTNEKTNLVFLTTREHFICHMLLVKFAEPEHLTSLRYALGMMRSRGKIVSSRSYEFARKQYLIAHIKNRTGTKHSEETKTKISKSNLGKLRSKEQCENVRLSQLGKTLSEDHKLKLSLANKDRSFSEDHKLKLKGAKLKIICPHCNKIGGKPVMIRFHLDNCKLKPEINL